MPPKLAIIITCLEQQDYAEKLAKELQVPCLREEASSLKECDYVLRLDETGLSLQSLAASAPGPLQVDFVHGAAAYRRQHGGGRRQPLARAVGLKPGINPSVLDATAGLGKDGFLLASLGCDVHMVERSPVIGALLADGLRRARQQEELQPIMQRIHLTLADVRDVMTTINADVIYLDPMYPVHGQAQVKKGMQILRQWLSNEDKDADDLLSLARQCARQRVVVKRPKTAPPLAEQKPDWEIVTPKHRFDVYALSL